jgi:hypothetical protein
MNFSFFFFIFRSHLKQIGGDWISDVFEECLKPYFLDAYRPIKKNNYFTIEIDNNKSVQTIDPPTSIVVVADDSDDDDVDDAAEDIVDTPPPAPKAATKKKVVRKKKTAEAN